MPITPHTSIALDRCNEGAVTSARRLRPLMGTLCAIEAEGPSEAVHHGIAAAFAAMTHVDLCMHPTRGSSDLARLNGSVDARVNIDPATWEVLTLAHQLHRRSDGVFDPCLPDRSGRMSDVELLPDFTAMCHAPVAIDLGGIAKGYAVDRAITALQLAGCRSGVVNAGGDVRVFGELSQQMTIRLQNRQHLNITLNNVALAVSEIDAPDRPLEHRGYYSRQANMKSTCNHVAILAEQAAVADALTKCAIFCSSTSNALLDTFNARRLDISNLSTRC